VNWFGDSLDGTVARVRHHERPRYGFYVDHVLDVVGILFLMAGLVLGGHMSGAAGAGFLLAYYLLMIEIALATHHRRSGFLLVRTTDFGSCSRWRAQLMRKLRRVAGIASLFDLGCGSAIGLICTFIASWVANTRTLGDRCPARVAPTSERRAPNTRAPDDEPPL
jgi:hypothetical protein